MNLVLNHEGFEQYIVKWQRVLGGVQYVFIFENGYGASVIKHEGSYGHLQDLWELAVIVGHDAEDWELTYTTPITGDVEGYLTDADVRELLGRIKELE